MPKVVHSRYEGHHSLAVLLLGFNLCNLCKKPSEVTHASSCLVMPSFPFAVRYRLSALDLPAPHPARHFWCCFRLRLRSAMPTWTSNWAPTWTSMPKTAPNAALSDRHGCVFFFQGFSTRPLKGGSPKNLRPQAVVTRVCGVGGA